MHNTKATQEIVRALTQGGNSSSWCPSKHHTCQSICTGQNPNGYSWMSLNEHHQMGSACLSCKQSSKHDVLPSYTKPQATSNKQGMHRAKPTDTTTSSCAPFRGRCMRGLLGGQTTANAYIFKQWRWTMYYRQAVSQEAMEPNKASTPISHYCVAMPAGRSTVVC